MLPGIRGNETSVHSGLVVVSRGLEWAVRCLRTRVQVPVQVVKAIVSSVADLALQRRLAVGIGRGSSTLRWPDRCMAGFCGHLERE